MLPVPYLDLKLTKPFPVTLLGNSLATPAAAFAPISRALGMILNGEVQSLAANTPGTFV